MDPGGGGGLEARRLLEIAEKLLDARDLVGSKRFAERALESDPLLEGVDQTLAIVDVLLASQSRFNNHMDSYSVLQLPHPSSSSSNGASSCGGNEDSLAIKRSYRRLALLLNPDRNRSPLAGLALRFVVDAYAVLSDPGKKSLLDNEIQSAAFDLRSNGSAEDTAARPVRTFWASCPSCCHVFEYDRSYLNRSLRCQTCQQTFHATEMAGKPPLVPGTDMYYCAWGFFPLGFRGGPNFPNSGAVVLPEFGDGWKPFIPITPVWGNQRGGQPEKPLNAVPVNFAAANQNNDKSNSGKKGNIARNAPGRNKKAVAKKRVGNFPKKLSFSGANQQINEGTETRGAKGSEAYTGTGLGISHFDVDLDATEDVLGNLHNLPFL